MLFLPADVVLTRSDTWLGRVIRAAERRPNDVAVYNHVGVITYAGLVPPPEGWNDAGYSFAPRGAIMVEALGHVMQHSVWEGYGPAKGSKQSVIAVYRPFTTTSGQRSIVAAKAETFVGQRYGWWKLGAHLLDAGISKVAGRDVRAARKLLFWDARPICSFLVAEAFAAAGLNFGVAPGTADPHDIENFCSEKVDKYHRVFEGKLS